MITQDPNPQLRFKEFIEPWKPLILGSFIQPRVDFGNSEDDIPLYSLTIEEGVTPKTERYNRTHLVKSNGSAYKVVFPGDFVYNPMNLRFGAIARHKESKKVKVSKYYDVFYTTPMVNGNFLAEYLRTHKTLGFYNCLATGALDEKKRVHFSDFVNFKRLFPKLEEQTKIADFLSSVDEKIRLLKEKHGLLKQYKKGVMQKLFSQEIRFKDDNGQAFPDWKTVSLASIAAPLKRRAESAINNVMTISAGQGFLHQKDRFSQIIAGTSLDKYTLLKKGEFSYNRGNSKSYTYGCIYKLDSEEEALVPYVYRSFRLNDGNGDFYAQLFSYKYLDKQLRRLISSSARMDGLLNIGEKDFYQVKLPYPCIEEQSKIADFLEALDKKIDAVQQQIELTQTFKKGLLQQMFV